MGKASCVGEDNLEVATKEAVAMLFCNGLTFLANSLAHSTTRIMCMGSSSSSFSSCSAMASLLVFTKLHQ